MKPRLLFLSLGIALSLMGCNVLPSSSSSGSEPSSSPVESSSVSSLTSSSSESSSSVISSSSSSSSSSSYDYSSLPDIPSDSRWDVDFTKVGREFMVTLSRLIKSTGGTTSYDNAINVGAKAAAYPNANSSTFIPFYRAPNNDNLATKKECNREHTWPNSRGGGMFENDPVMIRPTFIKDNSSRGNKFYGLGESEWDPAVLGYEAARGEAARVILYSAVTYYDLGITLSNNVRDAYESNTMGTLKTLLQWNRDYAPTEFEKTVNDRYDQLGYRRNPFVDHPGYAEYIYDENGIRASGQTEWHERIPDGTDLDGKKVLIVSADPKASGYYMMHDSAKGASIPWYISYSEVRYENGKVAIDREPVYFTLTKSGNAYTISTEAGNRLYGYVSGSFSSVCFGRSDADVTAHSSDATDISDTWNITLSGGYATFANTNGKVYLECYNGSFCGFSRNPNVKPMLFM